MTGLPNNEAPMTLSQLTIAQRFSLLVALCALAILVLSAL